MCVGYPLVNVHIHRYITQVCNTINVVNKVKYNSIETKIDQDFLFFFTMPQVPDLDLKYEIWRNADKYASIVTHMF
jgi:hypothetical protein